jgi:hypothetical protein
VRSGLCGQYHHQWRMPLHVRYTIRLKWGSLTRLAFTVPMSPASAVTPRFNLPWASAFKTVHPLTWQRDSNLRVRSALTVYIFSLTFLSRVGQIADPTLSDC